ncbi:MAG: hypothetical protein HQK99_11905 [Nitrospirae bacterium]|nr:hypothetical protein [Nitrospirota bacterium]
METLNDIEKAITALMEDDLVRLRDWFDEFDAEVWDRQFEEDAKSDRLKIVSGIAVLEFKQGRYKRI